MKETRWTALLSHLPDDRPLVGAEVGVWQGRMSEQLLWARPQLKLYMVDRWLAPAETDSYYTSGARMARHSQHTFDLVKAEAERRVFPFVGRAFILHGESVCMAERFKAGTLDFVFLDADHSYAAVTRDLQAWAPLVKRGGLLAGHDFGRTDQGDVERAVCDYLDHRARSVVTGAAWTWFFKVGE